jgi:CMP/dCMP kinase
VGTFPEVRLRLQSEQRRLATGKNLVTEGRDQGTVVFPHAEVKFFLRASAEVRAMRRHTELSMRGTPPSVSELIALITERDTRDETRVIDPLRPATDAILIDTSTQTPDAILARMLDAVNACRSRV